MPRKPANEVSIAPTEDSETAFTVQINGQPKGALVQVDGGEYALRYGQDGTPDGFKHAYLFPSQEAAVQAIRANAVAVRLGKPVDDWTPEVSLGEALGLGEIPPGVGVPIAEPAASEEAAHDSDTEAQTESTSLLALVASQPDAVAASEAAAQFAQEHAQASESAPERSESTFPLAIGAPVQITGGKYAGHAGIVHRLIPSHRKAEVRLTTLDAALKWPPNISVAHLVVTGPAPEGRETRAPRATTPKAKAADAVTLALYRALAVLGYSDAHRAYLRDADPNALREIEEALVKAQMNYPEQEWEIPTPAAAAAA